MTMRLPAALAGLAVLACAQEWKPADNPLSTPWTDQVHADRVLPEYPRPQMARAQWVNLNGLWEYAIRPKQEGRPEKFDGRILVPFAVESALSGVKRPLTPEDRLWYRRTFTVPKTKSGRLLLHFGAVDWRAEVFVNGKSVGMHEGGYDPFTFDVTDALARSSKNQELVVGVWDPTDAAMQPHGKQVLKPGSIWYTAVSGIWQTVWLERVPTTYVSRLALQPDIDARELRLTVRSGADAGFRAVAKRNGKTVGTAAGKANTEIRVPLNVMDLWSPDKPVLYDLEISLKGGDKVTSYFGMRSVEVRKDAAGFNRIYLNHKPVFPIGPLDQGWWPDGLYTAPTDEALRFDIDTLKKMGFNMCRKHVKVEPARWYYWCDKLGLMVWQDMPSVYQNEKSSSVRKGAAEDAPFTSDAAAGFRRELEAMMRGLANAPSIIAWVPFNEGWGQHSTNDVLKLAKSLDPSRLVDGPSGWEDRGFGDLLDKHEYPGPDMFPVSSARASVLGEFGGLGWPVKDHLWTEKSWGYRSFESAASLQTAYEGLIAKLGPLVLQGLAAAVYTQTTDVEAEVNGLVTYDRKVVKFDSARLAELHRHVRGLIEEKRD